jgi:lipopolysaccharide export system protein LptA
MGSNQMGSHQRRIMKRILGFLLVLVLIVVMAQEQTDTSQTDVAEPTAEEKRIIRIDSSGGTEEGDLRFGPINYTHPDPEGIKATVSNLSIFAQNAELRGPEGEEISLVDAEGRRIATFSGGLRVTRNRLEAKGPDLAYSEETGLGTMTGNATIHIEPKEEGDDPVDITTDEVEFDVDTDESISKGNVDLVSGNQTAKSNELIYEENRELGKLSSEGEQTTITRTDDDGGILTITADIIYVLTKTKKLHAIGAVTVVDGSITSKGDEVFFDDEKSRAEIIGNATAVDEEEGIDIFGERIEQRTDTDEINLIDDTVPTEFNADDFKLTQELEGQ